MSVFGIGQPKIFGRLNTPSYVDWAVAHVHLGANAQSIPRTHPWTREIHLQTYANRQPMTPNYVNFKLYPKIPSRTHDETAHKGIGEKLIPADPLTALLNFEIRLEEIKHQHTSYSTCSIVIHCIAGYTSVSVLVYWLASLPLGLGRGVGMQGCSNY